MGEFGVSDVKSRMKYLSSWSLPGGGGCPLVVPWEGLAAVAGRILLRQLVGIYLIWHWGTYDLFIPCRRHGGQSQSLNHYPLL